MADDLTSRGIGKSAEGKTDNLNGRIKDAPGGLAGDSDLQAEGKFDQFKGKAKDAGMLAAVGFVGFLALLALGESTLAPVLFGVVFLLMAPFLVYLVILIIWHWKARYRGTHSDLWGAFLLIETSGLTKLVYTFRHLIPDARQTGRYRRAATSPPA